MHSDVFREMLYPEIASQPTRLNWDNLSDEEQPLAKTFEDCREVCEQQKTCVQYSFRDGTCLTGARPRLGSARPAGNSASGWLTNRIRDKMDQYGLCQVPEFGE